jgi:SEC-C motif-containing protein
MTEPEIVCACGSGTPYNDCCEPFHNGAKAALTAVALMRSRYAAFVYGKIDYLVETTLPANRAVDLESHCRLTCESIHWIGLEVVGTSQGEGSDKMGKVEFKASYIEEGRIKIHNECSRFRRKGGRWYYVDELI